MNTMTGKKELRGLTALLDQRFYPNYQSEQVIFERHIERYLDSDSIVLDAGCGSGAIRYDYKHRVKLLVGCDVTELATKNPNLHYGIVANLERIPFPDDYFHLIFSRYVMEHLENPAVVFRELSRVLRMGGRIVLLTPNLHHYVTMISRFTSHSFHEKVAILRSNRIEDTFPTFYKANSRRDLVELCNGSGMEIETYRTIEAKPNYLTLSPITYAAGILYERLVNRFELLADFRINVLLVARK
jgi:SAM-dependent methyltransferase